MSQLITAELVDLDLSTTTKSDAARSLAERMVSLGRVTDLEGFLADVEAREAQMPTGLEGGIGIPHCRSTHVTEPTLAFGRPGSPIDFGAADGPADLVFLIAAPDGADSDHLTILSSLARHLADPEFTDALRSVTDPERASALIRGDTDPVTPSSAEQPEAPKKTTEEPAQAAAGPWPKEPETEPSNLSAFSRRSRRSQAPGMTRRRPPSPSGSWPSPPAPPGSPTPTWPLNPWRERPKTARPAR